MTTVALIGADGSGKTTVARRVAEEGSLPIRYLYMGSNPEASSHRLPTTRLILNVRRLLGKEKASAGGPPDPARRKRAPRGVLRRALSGIREGLRVVNLLAEEWYRQAVASHYERRGYIVLFDRHFYWDYRAHDISGDSGRRSFWRRIHGLVLDRFYPKPDLVILLDAPSRVLFERKREGTIELIESRRREYHGVRDLVRRFALVNADQPVDAVARDVIAAIRALRRDRSSGRGQAGSGTGTGTCTCTGTETGTRAAARGDATEARAESGTGTVSERKRAGRVLEDLRTRFVYRSLDAVLTAPLRSRKPRLQHLRGVVSPRSTNYDRVGSLVRLVDAIVPGTDRAASRLLFRPDLLPLRSERVLLLGSGSGATVFLLESERRRCVVKAYRRTIGRSRESLVELAAEYRDRWKAIASWYEGPYDVVAPARYLILHGPLLGQPAVACVQPYFGGEKRDPFTDFEDGELPRLMREDEGLGEQLRWFARRTLDLRAARGQCIDLLGARNLVVTRDRDRGPFQLKLIDYGIFDLRPLEGASPAAHSRLASLLDRMEGWLDAPPAPPAPAGVAVRARALAQGADR